MYQDKALKKVLENKEKFDLPYGFENLMMNQILLEAKKSKRRSAILLLCLISSVSLGMIVGTIVLFKYYLGVNISMPEIQNQFSPEAGKMFGFFFYIAFLVLMLLGLDTYLRRLKHKSENQ